MKYVSDVWNQRCRNAMNPLRNVEYINKRSVNDFKKDIEKCHKVKQESQETEKLRKKFHSEKQRMPEERNVIHK